jgi:hypothetical protein
MVFCTCGSGENRTCVQFTARSTLFAYKSGGGIVQKTKKGLAMVSADFLRTVEVGEVVVSHVYENVREPQPDFEAMRRMIGEPIPQKGDNTD